MAAELGTIAAVVQLLDVVGRLSIRLSRFCSDISEAPQRIHDLKAELDRQLNVTRDIRSRHATVFAIIPGYSTFDHPLQNFIGLVNTLHSELDNLSRADSDNVFQRRWKDIRAVRKKEEIMYICTLLEHKKSSLTLWLAAANT